MDRGLLGLGLVVSVASAGMAGASEPSKAVWIDANCHFVAEMSTLATTERRASAPQALDRLAQHYRQFQLATDPISAARRGVVAAAPCLPDARAEAGRMQADALRAMLNRAQGLDSSRLTPSEKVTHALLLHEIGQDLLADEFDLARLPFTNDSGFFSLPTSLAGSSRLRSVEDGDNLLRRYRAVPGYFDQHIANMRRGLATGFVQPRLVVERVVAILEASQISGDPREHVLYAPFKTLPGALAEADQTRLQNEAQEALTAHLAPAYAGLLAFMRDEYLPKARESLGISELENGRDYYAKRARFFTTTDMTPDEIHALGLVEVARIRAEMDTIIAELNFEGSFADFLSFLRNDDRFYASSEEDLLKEAAWIAKRADDQMPAFFGKLPRNPYGVRPVPAAIAPAYTTGRYFSGDRENGIAGGYMVNTYNLRARPLYELPALTLHEGVPGHHHQISLAQEIEGLPDFRTEVYVTAFGEGWGLYSEFLGYDMGIYRTPYERFGALSYEMWRACRLVVDTGLHWKGWSREQAEACFLENSALSIGNITTEVDRYIAWPGQALAYKIGELKIRDLRKQAEAALGAQFDIRGFHDAVLEDGAITLSFLEEKIEQWIISEQSKR
jgi:uncharacterized protein (DUF885 family)